MSEIDVVPSEALRGAGEQAAENLQTQGSVLTIRKHWPHKPVLIGEAPGRNTDPRTPLFPMPKNSAGFRLFSLTGLEWRKEYLELFERVNLFAEWPGVYTTSCPRGKDKWSTRDARLAAQAVRYMLRGRRAVLVGRRVQTAFGYEKNGRDYCEWAHDVHWNVTYASIPHPSGRNLWYNVPGNKERVQEFFQELLAQ